jgi:hypothetical protein
VPPSKSKPSKKPAKATSQGNPAKASAAKPGRTTPKAGAPGRYTPPTPKTKVSSPLWVPALMFALIVTGVLVVITNYLGLLPGEQQNWYLMLGLGEITAGFIVATFFR